MSCFIVGKASIDNILTTLYHSDYSNGGKYIIGSTCQATLEELERLGQAWWDLNYAAFARFYPEKADDVLNSFQPYRFKYGKVLKPFQLVKSLQCLNYQCEEYPEDKEPDVLKQLRRFRHEVTDAMVSRLPEYEEAEWE